MGKNERGERKKHFRIGLTKGVRINHFLLVLYFLTYILISFGSYYSMKIRGEFVDSIAIGTVANRILILLGLNLMIIFMLRYFLPAAGALIE